MSTDGDTVRAALHDATYGNGLSIRANDSARAALARLEAAARMAESNQSLMEAYRHETQLVEAQRGPLAEALQVLCDVIENEVFAYATGIQPTDLMVDKIVVAKNVARAAIAEAGLE